LPRWLSILHDDKYHEFLRFRGWCPPPAVAGRPAGPRCTGGLLPLVQVGLLGADGALFGCGLLHGTGALRWVGVLRNSGTLVVRGLLLRDGAL